MSSVQRTDAPPILQLVPARVLRLWICDPNHKIRNPTQRGRLLMKQSIAPVVLVVAAATLVAGAGMRSYLRNV